MALLSLAVAVALSGGPADVEAASTVPPPLREVGVEPPQDANVPFDVELRDPDGHRITTGALLAAQRPVLLTFAYSECPMLCSVVLRGLAEAVADAQGRPGRAYTVVTVSIDPTERPDVARRTKARLLSVAGAPDDPGAWRYLLGSEGEVMRLARSLGFRYRYDHRTEQYAHPAAIFVLTPDGRLSRVLEGLEHAPGAVDEAVAEAGRGGAAHDGRVSLLSTVLQCFRFDPADRRYGTAVFWTLRLFGFGLIGGLGVLVVVSQRRRRP